MKVKLTLKREGLALCEGIYDVRDATSFGTACVDVWNRLQRERLARTTSIGALYDELGDHMLEELLGAEIAVSRA
jgi:hypothetical protein